MNDIYEIRNFYPFPNELRDFALSQEFYDWTGPDGQIYKRVFITEIPGIVDMLSDLFGPVDMLGSGFRLNYNNELPNQSIHTDVGWGTHALVLYLCEGDSGTAFWEHKPTNLDRLVKDDLWMAEAGLFNWIDSNEWNLKKLVKIEFNKAIIYRSDLFHSRYPFEAFGNSPKNGRLIAVAFFTPENMK